MKIALCLYGVIGNKKGKAQQGTDAEILKLGHLKYQENLFSRHTTDVYLHTWSKDYEKEVLELYKPKKYIIEEQEIFNIPSYVKGDSDHQPNRRQNHYSRWRSTEKVLSLVSQNKEKYDFVLLSRYDVGFENPILFDNLNKDFFYCSNWHGVNYDHIKDIFQDGRGLFYSLDKKISTEELKRYGRGYPYDSEGILDLWFLASPDKMNIFESLYSNLNGYMKPGNCPQAPYVSNHKLSLHHIKENGMLNRVKFITDPTKDHCLLRYKYFNAKI